MADNTRKTSNIIHTVDGIKSDLNNLSQNIENNTESIGNIKVYDSHIWLSTSKGLTVTQDGNTTTNNDQPTEWKLEADTNYLNTTLNFAKSDEIPSVYVKDIKSGDITTLTVAEEDGVYTLTAMGGGGGGGIDNITLAEGTCIKIDSEPYDDNGTTKTRLTINTDTDCLNTTLNFAKPTDIGDGNITLKSTDNTVSITGANATANQATDTAWDLSVNIPTPPTPITPGDGAINLTGGTGIDVTGANGTANQTSDSNQTISIDSTVALKSDIPTIPAPVVPGDGNITLTEGDGITVSGADATANQTSDTAWTVKTDNDYLNKTLNFAKPGDIPTDLGVLTIESITPHADGDFDFVSSDDALVVNPTAHGLSLAINEDELGFVKEIKSGNELTLTVDDDGNGTVTLTAAGGGGGGAGDIAFAGGKCIDVDPVTVGDLTTYTINNDLDCLNTSLGFATDQDITDAIGNIAIPEKTSDLVNDGEGTDPFITAADIPAVPDAALPISSTDGTVVLDSPSANTFTVETGNASIELGANLTVSTNDLERVKVDSAGRLGVTKTGTALGFMYGIVDARSNSPKTLQEQMASSGSLLDSNSSTYSIRNEAKADGTYGAFVFRVTNSKNTNQMAGFAVEAVAEGNAPDMVWVVKENGGTSKINMKLDSNGNFILPNGIVRTSEISGLADNDASIELGANFSVVTGGNYAFQILNNRQVQVVSAGTIELPAICFGFLNTGFSFASGSDGKNDSPDAGLVFSTPNSRVSSTVNEIIRLRRDKQIVAADDYTPTQPNSIATRQFVLDQAGAAGLVPLGTPSDDTTPDSPNGSTLHDDLYLYVKGSTSWKKTALYPLDSSGGGSEFPLPQPGEDSGIAWETESVNLAFSQPGYGACGAAVGVAGNAFFAGNAWSVDGSQWFRVKWNGTTSGSYGVCDATSRTPAYGNGLYTGRYGYSYDGQSWTTYPNGAVGAETRECFFFQNKHYSMGGSRFFDGQLKANTNPNILGNIKNSAFVVPSNEGPSQTCLAINYSPPSGTNSLTLTDEAKRNVLLKFSGDMSTTGTWSQLQVEGSAIQTCYGLAHNDLDDKYCFITNNTSYVQKTAGNFTSSGWTKTTLPTTGEWAGLVHDGTHYVAVGIASGANISIYSEDGIAWSQSTTLSNPGVNTIAGFNGRVLAAGNLTSSDLAQILVTGNPTVTFTTKNIPLDHPVDVADSYMAQQYQMKETQADANELFTEEIQRRSPVLTLTQAEYDAISADEIEDDTLYLITS